MNRRSFCAAAVGLSAAAWLPARAQGAKTRLILLGTGGGPRPRKENVSASQVIVVNDQLYVVDCGDGVARQLVSAGLSLPKLRHVFITHHHSDHNADYGTCCSSPGRAACARASTPGVRRRSRRSRGSSSR
jgi:hypothetical protein